LVRGRSDGGRPAAGADQSFALEVEGYFGESLEETQTEKISLKVVSLIAYYEIYIRPIDHIVAYLKRGDCPLNTLAKVSV